MQVKFSKENVNSILRDLRGTQGANNNFVRDNPEIAKKLGLKENMFSGSIRYVMSKQQAGLNGSGDIELNTNSSLIEVANYLNIMRSENGLEAVKASAVLRRNVEDLENVEKMFSAERKIG